MEDFTVLSPRQLEVYDLYFNQCMPIANICSRLQISKQRVSQILSDIKKKGITVRGVDRGLTKYVAGSQGVVNTHSPVTNEWGYHRLHFLVHPYYIMPRYDQIRSEKGNIGIREGVWTLRLHHDSIRVQLEEKKSFDDLNMYEAIRKSEEDFNRTLQYCAEKYGFEYIKGGKANIRIVEQHLAKRDSAMAKSVDQNYLLIRAEDGKVRFIIDKSHGPKEHEYTHPDMAVRDAERLEPYINTLIDKQPMDNLQLQERLGEAVVLLHDTSKALHLLGEHIVYHDNFMSKANRIFDLSLTQIEAIKRRQGQTTLNKYN